MKTSEIIAMLTEETTYERMEAALKEADRRSYENPGFCYCVALYENGKIEIREHYGHENARYATDDAVAVLGSFSRENWCASDTYDSKRDLLNDLARAMSEEEKDRYSAWIGSETDEDFGEPDDNDKLKWIEANAYDAWAWVERETINAEIDAAESCRAYYDLLDDYIDRLHKGADNA